MLRSELEKRLQTRYPPTVYVSVFRGSNNTFFGLLADLSSTGFKLSSESDIIPGQQYDLSIRNPFSGSSTELIPFSVKAVWCSRNEDGLFDAGFQFVSYEKGGEVLFKRIAEDFDATARAIRKLDEESELLA